MDDCSFVSVCVGVCVCVCVCVCVRMYGCECGCGCVGVRVGLGGVTYLLAGWRGWVDGKKETRQQRRLISERLRLPPTRGAANRCHYRDTGG